MADSDSDKQRTLELGSPRTDLPDILFGEPGRAMEMFLAWF